MYLPIVTWLIVTASVMALTYILHCAWNQTRTRVPKLNQSDVVHFLYPVDWPLLLSLLDPAADFELRWNLSRRAFRAEQRRRMLLYRELVQRMSHNSAVLADFENTLLGNFDPTPGLDSKLRQAIIKVRLYSSSARLRLRIWLLLPNAFGIMPTPDLSRLRKAGSLDGPEVYGELRTAAAEAFAQLQPAEIEALTRSL
ncbi:MAG: hypothetical protein WCA49_25335 [Candidatus Sulfotelmatobacter sp.]